MPEDDKQLRSWINAKEKYLEKREIECKNKTLAAMFLRKVCQKQYGELIKDLHNQHTRGASQYPEDLSSTYTMVYQFRPERPVTNGAPTVGTQSHIPRTVTS